MSKTIPSKPVVLSAKNPLLFGVIRLASNPNSKSPIEKSGPKRPALKKIEPEVPTVPSTGVMTGSRSRGSGIEYSKVVGLDRASRELMSNTSWSKPESIEPITVTSDVTLVTTAAAPKAVSLRSRVISPPVSGTSWARQVELETATATNVITVIAKSLSDFIILSFCKSY